MTDRLQGLIAATLLLPLTMATAQVAESPYGDGPPVTIDDAVIKGQAAFRLGNYQEAQVYFDRALDMTQSASGVENGGNGLPADGNEAAVSADAGELSEAQRISLYFSRANAIVAASEQGDRDADLSMAVADYRRVLVLKPSSGTTMANLARTEGLRGNHDEAARLYEAAIALDDEHRTEYHLRYAEYLATRQPDKALDELQTALMLKPDDPGLQQRATTILMRPALAPAFVDALHRLVDSGQVLYAMESAAEALAMPDWPDAYRDALLEILARGFGAWYGSADSITARPFFQQLEKLAWELPRDEAEGLDQLLDIYRLPQHELDLSWWRSPDWDSSSRERAIAEAVDTYARWLADVDRTADAETLLTKSMALGGSRNPDAILDLVNFYSSQNDLAKLDALAASVEGSLFDRKGAAYQSRDWAAIYRFHRTLAAIYLAQDQTLEPSYRVRSAAYQVEHAYRAANQLDTITPDAELVAAMADLRLQEQNPVAARAVIADAQEAYLSRGDTVQLDALNTRVQTMTGF